MQFNLSAFVTVRTEYAHWFCNLELFYFIYCRFEMLMCTGNFCYVYYVMEHMRSGKDATVTRLCFLVYSNVFSRDQYKKPAKTQVVGHYLKI